MNGHNLSLLKSVIHEALAGPPVEAEALVELVPAPPDDVILLDLTERPPARPDEFVVEWTIGEPEPWERTDGPPRKG